MVKKILIIATLLLLKACAGHQDLLAPEYPGQMQPVIDQEVAPSNGLNKENRAKRKD